MKKQTKIDVVESIVGVILRDMVQKIEENKIPRDWDGIELRWWITDHFQPDVIIRPGFTSVQNKKRYKDYINERLIGGF